LDIEINEEAEKTKMTSDFASTFKKLDSHLLDIDPGNIVDQEGFEFLDEFGFENEAENNILDQQPSSLEQEGTEGPMSGQIQARRSNGYNN